MDISWLVAVMVAVVVIITSLLYWVKLRCDNYWKQRGVKPMPNKSNTKLFLQFLFAKKTNEDLFRHYYKISEDKCHGYFQFFSPALMVCDPELIMQILIKDFSHFEDRTPPLHKKDILGLGLGSLSTDEWRNARHLLTPAFTSGKLKIMFTSITKKSAEVVDYLKGRTGQELDGRDLAMKFILNVIGDVAFGLQVDTLNDLNQDRNTNDFLSASSKFFRPSYKQLIKSVTSICLPKLAKFLNFTQIDGDINDFFLKLTTDTINYRQKNGVRRNDFLQLMLDQRHKIGKTSQNKTENNKYDVEDSELINQLNNIPVENSINQSEILTDAFIAAQSFIFISGGSETTSTVISFILLELALNQNFQEQVYQEVNHVLSNNEFEYQSIKKLKYMEQFINETLRVHPIVIAQLRMCTRSYKIPGTECVIEKGTFITIPVVGLHNDPKYFADPEKFNPDRFENMETIPKGVFHSFSYGPRMCIATRFAMLEMKIFLAILLSTYKVNLGKKTKLPLRPMKNALLPNIEGGIWIQFEKRKI